MKRNEKYIYIVLAVIALIVVLLSSSCKTPQEQEASLFKKYPYLKDSTVHDRIKVDTIVTKEYHKDSIIGNIYTKDTIFLHEKDLTVKYLYKGGDSAFLGGNVKADTIYKHDTTTIVKNVYPIIPEKTLWQKIKDDAVLICIGFIICLVIVIYLFSKISKLENIVNDVKSKL